MERILITGGTGYLGSVVVRQAVEAGYQVRVLCRRVPEAMGWPASVEVALGDLTVPATLAEAVRGCEAVIHTAGLVSAWQVDAAAMARINVEGTENLLAAAFGVGVKRVVYTSSFFALGPTGERPADERHATVDECEEIPYIHSKREGLRRVRDWIGRGHAIVPVYPGMIYGPGKATDGNYITVLIEDFSRRRMAWLAGDGMKRFTLAYVEDVAKGHLLALRRGEPGAGYILGGEGVTLYTLYRMLQELTGKKGKIRRMPLWIGYGFAWWEECRLRWNPEYKPVLTRALLPVLQRHWWYTSQKAIGELGYTRMPVKMGLYKTLESLGLVQPERSTML